MVGSEYCRLMKIRSLHIIPFALFQMVIFGLLGLLFGLIYAVGSLLIDSMVSLDWLAPEKMGTPGLSYGTFLAFGALLGMPMIGLVSGFSTGLVTGALFNLFTKMTRLQLPYFIKE